jgi:hypothetical protein
MPSLWTRSIEGCRETSSNGLRKFEGCDKRRRDLSFEIGDFVYLKVSPMRGTHRFRVKGKLAPRYVRPFKIIDRMREVAYQLELSP